MSHPSMDPLVIIALVMGLAWCHTALQEVLVGYICNSDVHLCYRDLTSLACTSQCHLRVVRNDLDRKQAEATHFLSSPSIDRTLCRQIFYHAGLSQAGLIPHLPNIFKLLDSQRDPSAYEDLGFAISRLADQRDLRKTFYEPVKMALDRYRTFNLGYALTGIPELRTIVQALLSWPIPVKSIDGQVMAAPDGLGLLFNRRTEELVAFAKKGLIYEEIKASLGVRQTDPAWNQIVTLQMMTALWKQQRWAYAMRDITEGPEQSPRPPRTKSPFKRRRGSQDSC